MTGKESAGKCNPRELGLVLDEFKRLGWADRPAPRKRAGDRPLARTAIASKIRALWLSLYHLGEVDDPSEAALAAFVERCTDVQALQWLDGEQADTVIRALRGWLDRVTKKLPSAQPSMSAGFARQLHDLRQLGVGEAAKAALIEAQLGMLLAFGIEPDPVWMKCLFDLTEPGHADSLVELIGARIRCEKEARK